MRREEKESSMSLMEESNKKTRRSGLIESVFGDLLCHLVKAWNHHTLGRIIDVKG